MKGRKVDDLLFRDFHMIVYLIREMRFTWGKERSLDLGKMLWWSMLRVLISSHLFLWSKEAIHQFSLSHVILSFSFQRKCDQYWPERGTRNYGQVQVTLKETLNMSHYTVRKLVMTHKMVSYRVLTIIQSRHCSHPLDCWQRAFSLRVRRVLIRKRAVWTRSGVCRFLVSHDPFSVNRFAS